MVAKHGTKYRLVRQELALSRNKIFSEVWTAYSRDGAGGGEPVGLYFLQIQL